MVIKIDDLNAININADSEMFHAYWTRNRVFDLIVRVNNLKAFLMRSERRTFRSRIQETNCFWLFNVKAKYRLMFLRADEIPKNRLDNTGLFAVFCFSLLDDFIKTQKKNWKNESVKGIELSLKSFFYPMLSEVVKILKWVEGLAVRGFTSWIGIIMLFLADFQVGQGKVWLCLT